MSKSDKGIITNEEEISNYKKALSKLILSDDSNGENYDLKAKEESKNLGLDEKLNNRKKEAWHNIFIWGLRFVAICLAVMFLVRVLHMILPSSRCWLTDAQIKSLNEIVFGGLVGALIGKQMKQIIPN